MDLQAIEARLRDWHAGRNSELVEHAPEDIRALIEEVGRLTVEHLEMRIERDNLRERRDYYRKAVMKADGEIEAAKALHRKMPLFAEWVCSECFNDGGEYVDYPCETARALGVTE